MNKRKIIFSVLSTITLLLVACSGGDNLSVAQVDSPDPTATPAPTPTEEPTATPGPASPTPTAAPEPASPTPTAMLDSDLGSFEDIDMAGLMQEVMNSPEFMGCLTSSMSISSLMGLAERQPTDDEMALILPCFRERQVNSLLGGTTGLNGSPEPTAVPKPTAAPAPTEAPVVLTQTALARPEGVPWYDGPLFDSQRCFGLDTFRQDPCNVIDKFGFRNIQRGDGDAEIRCPD